MYDPEKFIKSARKVCYSKKNPNDIKGLCFLCSYKPIGSEQCKEFRDKNDLGVRNQETPMSLINKFRK
jgi:hypothetical protein